MGASEKKKKGRGSINEYDEIGQQGVAAALETQPEPDDRKFNFIYRTTPRSLQENLVKFLCFLLFIYLFILLHLSLFRYKRHFSSVN